MVLPNKFKIAFKVISSLMAGIFLWKGNMKKVYLSLFLFSLITSFIFASSITMAKTDAPFNRAYQPVEIRKTNIKDTKFTISWRTIKKTIGQIRYGETLSIEQTAFDDKGQSIISEIHCVTIRNLKPDTVYYYKIVSEGKAYQNNNQPFTITTGPSIMATGSDVAYGRIYSRKNIPYKDGAIIYLTLRDKDGIGSKGLSSPVSVLTDKNGYWSYELKNFREKNLNNLFTYSAAGDILIIEIQAESLSNTLLLKVDTKDDSPVRNIVIK